MTTAFVLGGGGVLGAVEVGMLRALFERDLVPDLVLGTSIGAFNGALVASQPELAVVERQERVAVEDQRDDPDIEHATAQPHNQAEEEGRFPARTQLWRH